MTSSSPSSPERERIPQNWHLDQASLAIEAAYSRITQVRHDLLRLSNGGIPDASSSPYQLSTPDSVRSPSADQGWNTLLTPPSMRGEIDANLNWYYPGPRSFNAAHNAGATEAVARRSAYEFSSNNFIANAESASSPSHLTSARDVSPRQYPPNVLPPQRHLSSSNSSRILTTGERSEDFTQRDAQRFQYVLEHSSNNRPPPNHSSVDRNGADTGPTSPQQDTQTNFYHPRTNVMGEVMEQSRRRVESGLQVRRLIQPYPDILQQRLAGPVPVQGGQNTSIMQEFDYYSGWRDQEFPLWLPSEDREWEFQLASEHPATGSAQTRREPVRPSQPHNTTAQARPLNVAPRRADPTRRGWARLDSDGIEIPQNEEEELERTRTEYRMRALRRSREGRTTTTYIDATGGTTYRAPVVYGSVMDAAIQIQSTGRRQASCFEKKEDVHRPHVPFHIDPLPMPLASMEINSTSGDDVYVDIVVPRQATFAGR